MRSIVSKKQAKVNRVRAKASKIKLAFMKELRVSLEEIKRKTSIEIPPLVDMADNQGDDSKVDSDAIVPLFLLVDTFFPGFSFSILFQLAISCLFPVDHLSFVPHFLVVSSLL
jgi:hypothetical protein